jgi:hypothetical protein
MSAATVKKTFGELFKTPHNGVFAIDVGCQEAILRGIAYSLRSTKQRKPNGQGLWTRGHRTRTGLPCFTS